MRMDEARELVREFTENGDWLSRFDGDDNIQIDGEVSLKLLKAIIFIMENSKEVIP